MSNRFEFEKTNVLTDFQVAQEYAIFNALLEHQPLKRKRGNPYICECGSNVGNTRKLVVKHQMIRVRRALEELERNKERTMHVPITVDNDVED